MNEIALPADAFQVAHGASLERSPHGLIFSDSKDHDWHLVRAYHASLNDALVRVEIKVRPTPQCNTDFYLNAVGGKDIAIVTAAGAVKDRGVSRRVIAIPNADGSFTVTALYESKSGSVTFGTHCKTGMYAGAGDPQYIVETISVFAGTGSFLDVLELEERLTLIDIGAAGGIQDKWEKVADQLSCVFFEPGTAAAAELRQKYADSGTTQVLESALFNMDGSRHLYLTKFIQCSSLLKPKHEALSIYKVAPCFDVAQTVKVDVRRYDSLWREGKTPIPDAIKIDVQGAEYEVLEGFGDLLQSCIGIELETHFYQIYEGQKTIANIIEYLARFGLYLRKVEPQMSFDNELVEVNAYFTKRRAHITDLQDRKLQIIEHVWGLGREHAAGAQLGMKYG